MITGMFLGYKIKTNLPDSGIFFTEKRRPVQEVLNLIETKYVDLQNSDSLGDAAIEALGDERLEITISLLPEGADNDRLLVLQTFGAAWTDRANALNALVGEQ